ncbi:2'-deoxymugineic-acid 2'-dioxygenase-like [Silene latifolia]|uniref:2'-deoxymugineic-acid 2'-dioxygenase-like n=1 Tax=Silene latifolia TaxID=37657 RepID=UPI003D78582A
MKPTLHHLSSSSFISKKEKKNHHHYLKFSIMEYLPEYKFIVNPTLHHLFYISKLSNNLLIFLFQISSVNMVRMRDLLTHHLLNNSDPNYFPESHRLLAEEGPFRLDGPRATIPSVSLHPSRFTDEHCRGQVARDILRAAEEYGMFEVTNHSISADVMRNAMTESTRFFELPEEQINAYMALVKNKPHHYLYTSNMKNHVGLESNHFWRDALTLNCDGPQPAPAWPSQPPNFRRAVWEFASEVRLLQERLLDLMSEGLGLGRNYFGSRNYNGLCSIVVNRYPRCPDPTWAIGMAPHGDPSLITISIPANGLQIWKDGEFKYVVPSSNALLVTVGRQLEIVTTIEAPGHQVVVNSQSAQTSLSFFAFPTPGCEVTQAPNISRESRYIDGVPFGEFIGRHLLNNRNPTSILPHFYSRR